MSFTNEEILNIILSNPEKYKKDYKYIIDGKSGPTGKSWLTRKLIEAGYNAIDVSDIAPVYHGEAEGNYILLYAGFHAVIIILNNILEKYKDRIIKMG